MGKSKPVLRFLTPTSCNTAAFSQPTEGSLDHPTPGGEARLTRNGTFFLWLIAPAPMLDVGDVMFQTHKDMHILVVIAFVRTKVLFAVRPLGDNVNDQIIDRPFVMFVGTSDKYGQGSSPFIHQEMNFAARFGSIGRIFACFRAAQGRRAHHAIDRLPFPANPTFPGIELDHLLEQLLEQSVACQV